MTWEVTAEQMQEIRELGFEREILTRVTVVSFAAQVIARKRIDNFVWFLLCGTPDANGFLIVKNQFPLAVGNYSQVSFVNKGPTFDTPSAAYAYAMMRHSGQD